MIWEATWGKYGQVLSAIESRWQRYRWIAYFYSTFLFALIFHIKRFRKNYLVVWNCVNLDWQRTSLLLDYVGTGHLGRRVLVLSSPEQWSEVVIHSRMDEFQKSSYTSRMLKWRYRIVDSLARSSPAIHIKISVDIMLSCCELSSAHCHQHTSFTWQVLKVPCLFVSLLPIFFSPIFPHL